MYILLSCIDKSTLKDLRIEANLAQNEIFLKRENVKQSYIKHEKIISFT